MVTKRKKSFSHKEQKQRKKNVRKEKEKNLEKINRELSLNK